MNEPGRSRREELAPFPFQVFISIPKTPSKHSTHSRSAHPLNFSEFSFLEGNLEKRAFFVGIIVSTISSRSISFESSEERLATSILSVNKKRVTALSGLFVSWLISNASKCATKDLFWLIKEHFGAG